MILGLDISTSITGITVLNEDGTVLHNEAINLTSKKLDNIFKKAEAVKNRLTQIKYLFNIKNVFIEQSLNGFRAGFSSAKTILTLTKFNGIVSWICCELFNLDPEYIGASTARKSIGIKVEKGQNAKEIVLAHILGLDPQFKVEYTASGNPKSGTYDRADSYVIAKSGYLLCQKRKK